MKHRELVIWIDKLHPNTCVWHGNVPKLGRNVGAHAEGAVCYRGACWAWLTRAVLCERANSFPCLACFWTAMWQMAPGPVHWAVLKTHHLSLERGTRCGAALCTSRPHVSQTYRRGLHEANATIAQDLKIYTKTKLEYH